MQTSNMCRSVIGLALVGLMLATAAGCANDGMRSGTPLPDADSTEAKVYAANCGSCHAIPHPKRLSFASWQDLLVVMDKRIAERGLPAISAEDKKAILIYLKAHGR